MGVLEWHENQCLMSRLLGKGPETLTREGFILHFLNGGVAALFYAVIVDYLSLRMNTALLGVLFGLLLWVLTLAPIHKPITGVSLTKHPLGLKPVLLSLAVHAVYGVVVAYMVNMWLG